MNNAEQKIFFQQCLYTALMKLMQEKEFEKISVGELCQAAGVSRMTYYRSYSQKKDILMQHLEECFESYLNGLRAENRLTFYDIAFSFFSFWQESELPFLDAVIRSGQSSQLINRFYEYLEQVYASMESGQPMMPYVRSFLAGGLYKMLVDWVQEGARTPIPEMAEFLAKGAWALTQEEN